MNGTNTVSRQVFSRFSELYNALYKEEPVGGALHIITDDQNVENSHIEFCRAELKKGELCGRPYRAVKECHELLDILEPMTMQERFWLVSCCHEGADNWYPPEDQAGARTAEGAK